MLGASTDYVFLWNYETAQTTIIPRTKINEISLILSVPELRPPPDTYKISTNVREKIIHEIKAEHDKWIKNLFLKCKQVSPPPRM
ncbi:hypothetical protein UNDKW_1992 [Undibacterium sp. KW1]|nr:hypothetical protein UNDKW_1992 [Undibacterium sp. KW1]